MNDFLQSLRNGQAEKPRTPKTRKNYDNSYQHTSAPRFHSYSGYQNTRNHQMKRPQHQHPGNQMPSDDISTSSMLAEAIENLNSHIEALAKNQDYLITVQEKTADMLERQAVAIERIVDHLNLDAPPKKEKETEYKQTSTEPKKAFKNHYVSSRSSEPEVPEPVKAKAPVKIKVPIEETKPAPVRSVIRKRKRVAVKKPIESAISGTRLLGRDEVMNIINTMRAEGATFDQVASHLVSLGQPTFSGRGEWHAQTIHRLCSKK